LTRARMVDTRAPKGMVVAVVSGMMLSCGWGKMLG